MRKALEITEAGMARGIAVLKRSKPGKGQKLEWSGKVLTSELLRAEIDTAVLRAGGLPANTIVAGGDQACDPHERGHGPLKANSLIILDIFPRSAASGYYGDLTRTVVRGRASDAQRKLWETVNAGQALALKKMKPGVDGLKLHKEIQQFFTGQGYPTALREEMGENLFVGGRLAAFPLHFFFKNAVGQKLVRLRLFASAIDFEIAQDQRALPVLLEENKRIRREKARRIKHVRIVLARGYDEAGLVFGFHNLFLRTTSWRRKIRCRSQSRIKLDPRRIAVLKAKTLTVVLK
jgi:hypothetical protein